MTVGEVDWAVPGTKGGMDLLESFCRQRLKYFEAERNNPNKDAVSNLSPWINFGKYQNPRFGGGKKSPTQSMALTKAKFTIFN